ncbi:hypothetical protein HQ50_03255 [Porphyromonas sp. COT-052 OH4946]|uniref:hypothetical protein n=1 Tax=Porphyromonas sp. COT-052 OH4946 TaxID=1515618 RepID=UPI00051DD702|nr:hypothetical protein [Porphyromonas sp. COT-052 OH4946]KGL56030.1 hypothetical protein HQ50_03255 [Porphyromonas sp. COT-052 OH4946]
METVVAKIIFGVGEDGFVYGSKDRPDVCPVCGNRIKDVYDLHYRLNRKSTFMYTYDGYNIVSQPFKDFCDANGYQGLSFTELTHYPGYYFFSVENVFELDPDKINFKKFFLIIVGLETEKKMKQYRLKKIHYVKVVK